MVLSDISVPEVYKSSADFRFFLRWFELCLSKIQNDTENLIDLLDPLRCPSDLLWMLADTCGYKYDERLTIAFNRLVILNFARLIRNRGSETGMIYAAELNLTQFSLNDYAIENPILEDRLDDTAIPVNTVSVIPHTKLGFIDLIYASQKIPVDACVEYVRPIGMYCFAHAGIQVNARTKISVDARLTNLNDTKLRPGPTFVAHYRREDYASLQGPLGKLQRSDYLVINPETGKLEVDEEAFNRAQNDIMKQRRKVWYRNGKYEGEPNPEIDPGLRTLYSVQLSNNEHIVRSLIPDADPEQIFSLGYGPQDVDVVYPDDYLKRKDEPLYNLRLDRATEESMSPQVSTVDSAPTVLDPRPAVNPPMATLGDAISMDAGNRKYTKVDPVTGEITIVTIPDDDT